MLNSLFWKVSAIFLALLLVFTAIVLRIHITASSNHALEVTQRMNRDLAQHTVGEIKPFLNGEVTDEAIGTLMHSMMAVNPGIEVYVLDTVGRILKYVALEGEVRSDRVDLAPVRAFMATTEQDGLWWATIRAPGERKIFSAAPVMENGVARGYVYIILAGQEYAGATETLFGSYFLRLGSRSVLIALAFTLVFGLLAIWFITQNIERVVDGIRRFPVRRTATCGSRTPATVSSRRWPPPSTTWPPPSSATWTS
ncbi:MAG: hypothetical protein IPN62_17670 [Flavobacteriales bacterium]|nr:hypothetical protein [Flavobacteriales bacterium]